MNPKIQKLRTERDKNEAKIAALRARNGEIDQHVTELENLDIVGMVRSLGMTPEQLAALLDGFKASPAIPGKEEIAHG